MAVAGPPRRRGRPAQISRERITAAALSVENLDALTMRELAARLEVSHAALYRWVKNRDELFDLLSAALVDRILASGSPGTGWRQHLTHIAWGMHDQFLALPGYATHLSRPHPHHAHSVDRLQQAVTGAFTGAGVSPEIADQSWYIFITAIVGWLAFQENPVELGTTQPSFELFLGTLLRGLPAREPGSRRPRGLPDV